MGLSIAEVDHHDLWQRAGQRGALTGGDLGRLDHAVDKVERWLDDRFPTGVHVERTLASFEDIG
jgi:uncharacterized protein YlxP (DUF503 family)